MEAAIISTETCRPTLKTVEQDSKVQRYSYIRRQIILTLQ